MFGLEDGVVDSRCSLVQGSMGNELTEDSSPFLLGRRERVFMELDWYKSYVEVQIPKVGVVG